MSCTLAFPGSAAPTHPAGPTTDATPSIACGPMRVGREEPAGARRGGEAVGGVLIGLASLLFGLTVILGDVVQGRGLNVLSMLAVRFAIAALLLAVILLPRRRPILPARGERLPLAFLGMVGYAVEASLFFAAIDRGEVAAVTLLFFTYPVFVTIGSVLLGRGAPGLLLTGSLVCALAGVSLVVATSGGLAISASGVVFAVSAAAMFAAYLLGADMVLKRTEAMAGSMWVSAWAAVALALYAAVTGNAETPGAEHWGPLLGMAAATAGAFVVLFAGLVRLGPVRTSIIAASEPLSATLLAALILDQAIRGGVAIGGVMILAGAVMASLARSRSAVEPPVP